MIRTAAHGEKIRVLVVYDSTLVRRLLSGLINQQEGMEAVGAAPDPFVARDMLLELQPDVMTLDLEMPRMNGLTFLEKIMQYRPMPVLVISSVTPTASKAAIEALPLGAVDVLSKPNGPNSVGNLAESLSLGIRAAAYAKARGESCPLSTRTLDAGPTFHQDALIAIGASTGGTQALEELLTLLPGRCPPIVIAQHIPAGFSTAFANRLNSLCRIEVREAVDGDELLPGRALIAPGDTHLMVNKISSKWRVAVRIGPRICYQRPSVDVLFRSAAESGSNHATGILLTGMGTDGAEGLLQMRKRGAMTIAQDEETSVVFGMPKAAIEAGAAGKVLPLSKIMRAALRDHSAVPTGYLNGPLAHTWMEA